MFRTTVFFAGIVFSLTSFGQDSATNKRIAWSLEIRPRIEYRRNYSQLTNDPLQTELYASQRNRFSFTYSQNTFVFHASVQEIHLWGKNDKISSIGGINAYELYVQQTVRKHFSIKLGRQGVLLDNGRIFSDAPWAQQSRAHEGIRFGYSNRRLNTALYGLATRKYRPLLEKSISPVSEHKYKSLFIHHLTYKPSASITLTSIQAMESFRNTALYHRFTSGGRAEWEKDVYYATISGYFQYGKSSSTKKLHAYYLQPEIRLTTKSLQVRLGAEIISGDKRPRENRSGSFDVLYGVAWKFMGNMNFFTRFPADLNGRGLVNPYLFTIVHLGKNLTLRSDAHLFYTQYPQRNTYLQPSQCYLGFENDISIRFQGLKHVDISQGFSWFLAQPEMEKLGKLVDYKRTPVWYYLMVSYTFKNQ